MLKRNICNKIRECPSSGWNIQRDMKVMTKAWICMETTITAFFNRVGLENSEIAWFDKGVLAHF